MCRTISHEKLIIISHGVMQITVFRLSNKRNSIGGVQFQLSKY